MTPWFNTPARIAALEAAAAAWIGTPYVQSGAVRGSGASCHKLGAAVLIDAGYPLPPAPERGLTKLHRYTAAMRAWLEEHPKHFAAVPLEALAPGDVLLCEIGIGHIGLYVGDPGARALQVLRNAATHYVSLNDPQARRFVLAAYRPLDPAAS